MMKAAQTGNTADRFAPAELGRCARLYLGVATNLLELLMRPFGAALGKRPFGECG